MKAQPTPSADPWRYALDALQAEEPAVLVMVVDHSGSVPGVTGTIVVVTGDGQAGTIGGGAAEHTLVDEARRHHGDPIVRDFVHTEKGDGTLCNGVQRFVVLPLARHDLTSIEEIISTLDDHEIGALTVTPKGLTLDRGESKPTEFVEHKGTWAFSTTVGLLDTLTIVGGGHVALALSRLMVTLPFRVVVLDNRTELKTMDDNPYAHRKEVVDYDHIAEHVPGGDRSWVVVMTFGHKHDRRVVENLLAHEVRYLGLLGSATKVRRLFADMNATGADPEAVARVRAPVGVAIRSHTPEEIAVSVAAEIIGIRNGALE